MVINFPNKLDRAAVIVSGGFDPLHVGHIEMMEAAIEKTIECVQHDRVYLYVLLNSDAWLKRKKGYVFMRFLDRMQVLESIGMVYGVLPVWDEDDTVCQGIRAIKTCHPEFDIFFANGGDRNEGNTPEDALCDELGVVPIYGCGLKVRASSDMVKKAAEVLCEKLKGGGGGTGQSLDFVV